MQSVKAFEDPDSTGERRSGGDRQERVNMWLKLGSETFWALRASKEFFEFRTVHRESAE